MPSLLAAMHQLIPSESIAFFWADERGGLAGFSPEYAIPEILANLLRDFEGLVEKTLPLSLARTMQRGQPIGDLLPSSNAKFYGGPIYHLVYRPYRLHHAIDLVVRDNGRGIGKGAMVIGRSARQPEFSALERGDLQQLLPYIAHALHAQKEAPVTDFTNSGEPGLVILTRTAKIAYASPRAREILHLAASPAHLDGKWRSPTSASLQSIHERLIRIFEERNADAPVIEHCNAAGRFIYRAHWLDAQESGRSPLIAVTIQHQEPLQLVMLRNMHAAGLSAKQTEVALLLAQDQSFDAIAAALHISRATAKDYAQRIYRKVNVHSKEELMQVVR
jgi:DNA-binding CsgD family transcriptional regulator